MRIPRNCRKYLCHRDRWRLEQMLTAQPDLQKEDPERDLNLWRHLFAPNDVVRVGDVYSEASSAKSGEYCWGNTWRGDAIEATAALCWSASALLRGATYREAMSRSQACEAVLGRLRVAGIQIVMVVDDGGGGLECWIDPEPGSHPVPSKGRCPGGRNNKTGQSHRVVWADPVARIAWEKEITQEVA